MALNTCWINVEAFVDYYLHPRLIDTLQAFDGISLGAKYFDQLGEVKLLNSQAVAVWKHIFLYQDKQRRGM